MKSKRIALISRMATEIEKALTEWSIKHSLLDEDETIMVNIEIKQQPKVSVVVVSPEIPCGQSIRELGLSTRMLNLLENADIFTISKLCQQRTCDLMKIRDFGVKSVKDLIKRLGERGLALAGEIPALFRWK